MLFGVALATTSKVYKELWEAAVTKTSFALKSRENNNCKTNKYGNFTTQTPSPLTTRYQNISIHQVYAIKIYYRTIDLKKLFERPGNIVVTFVKKLDD